MRSAAPLRLIPRQVPDDLAAIRGLVIGIAISLGAWLCAALAAVIVFHGGG